MSVLQDYLKGHNPNYKLILEVLEWDTTNNQRKDPTTAGNWVDWTDLVSAPTAYKDTVHRSNYAIRQTYLKKVASSIAFSADRTHGGVTDSAPTIHLDNSTRYFDDPASSDFGASWYKRWVRIVISVRQGNGTETTETLYTWLIKSITVRSDDMTAIMKTMSFWDILRDADLSGVRNGQSDYLNRSRAFIFERVAEKYFLDRTTGALPSTWSIPDIIQLQSKNNTRFLSHYGQPPERTSSGWRDSNLITRAMTNHLEKIYLGIKDEMWEFDADTDTYTQLGTIGDDDREFRFMCNDSGVIYGFAWDDTTDFTANPHNDAIYVRKYTISTQTFATMTSIAASNYPFIHGFCMRDGQEVTPDRYIGQTATANDGGENVSIPYTQYVDTYDIGAGDTIDSTSGIFTDINWSTTTTDVDLPATVTPGYYGIEAGGAGSGNLYFRWTLGQYRPISFDADEGKVVFASLSSSSDMTACELKTYTLSSGTTSTIGSFALEQIITLKCIGDSRTIISHMDWEGASGAAVGINYLGFYDLDLSSGTLKEDTFNSATSTDILYKYNCVVEIEKTDTANDFYAVLYSRENRQYRLARWVWNGGGGVYDAPNWITGSSWSDLQPKGLKYVEEGSNDYIYLTENGSGRLGRVDLSTHTLSWLDDSLPAVDGSAFLAIDQLVYMFISSRPTMWGISRTDLDDYFLENAPSGKHYLWKYDEYDSGRIPQAALEGVNAKRFFSDIFPQSVGYRFYFDEDGDGILEALPTSTSPAITLSDRPPQGVSYSRTVNNDEIRNYLQGSPYESVYHEPEVTLTIVDRNDLDADSPNSDIIVQQRNVNSLNIRLRCEVPGTVASSGGQDGTAQFSILFYKSTITTELDETVTGTNDYDFKLKSVSDIAASDELEIGEEGQFTISTVDTDPESANHRLVTLSDTTPGWSQTLPRGLEVTVYKQNNGAVLSSLIEALDTYQQISDSGVFIKWDAPGAEIGFVKGDVIDIECKGLTLEKDDRSKLTLSRIDSISDYGKSEFGDVDNILIQSLSQLKLRSARLLDEVDQPKDKLILEVPYLLLHDDSDNRLMPLDIVRLESKYFDASWNHMTLDSGDLDYGAAYWVRKIQYDLNKSRTKLTCVSVSDAVTA